MRISDWSSDVCSSDLHRAAAPDPDAVARRRRHGPPGLGADRGLAGHEAKPRRLACLSARADDGRAAADPDQPKIVTARGRPAALLPRPCRAMLAAVGTGVGAARRPLPATRWGVLCA